MKITVNVSFFKSMATVLALRSTQTLTQRISQAVFKGIQLEAEISCSSTAEV